MASLVGSFGAVFDIQDRILLSDTKIGNNILLRNILLSSIEKTNRFLKSNTGIAREIKIVGIGVIRGGL